MRRLIWILLFNLAFGQEIRRPTQDIDPGNIPIGCTGTNEGSSPMPNSWDAAGLTTSSSVFAFGNDTSQRASFRTFKNWQSTGNTYTALTLNVNASFAAESPSNACIKYSIDGGSTYTTVKCSSISFGQQTYSITLSPSQNLSTLRVSACASGGKSNVRAGIDPGDETVTISDIWTSGTNPSPDAGTGSGAGQPHRGAVVSN